MQTPAIGSDVSALMPPVGADVSALMGGASTPAPAAPSSWLSELKDYAKAALEGLDPVTNAAKGIDAVVFHLPETISAIGQAQAVPLDKAKAAWQQGHKAEAARHFLDYLVPILGPALDHATDKIQAGQVGEGLGDATAIVGNTLLPATMGKSVPSAPPGASGALRSANPVVADAVDWGMQQGIPVDAATATDNAAVKAVQHLSDRTLGGSLVAGAAKAKQGTALATVGEQLAAKGYPSPVTPEQAGTAIQDATVGRIQQLDATADTAYGKLRAIAAQQRGTRAPSPSAPIQAMDMPVDLRQVKPQIKPLYDQLKREAELVPLMGDKARALTALDRLMQAPDFESLPIVDQALGDLKALARGKDGTLPALRSAGQGVAGGAVKYLDALVRSTAAKAGPDALQALEDGRAATTAKFAVAKVYDAIRDEPVQAFNQVTSRADTAIDHLRDVAKVAPAELPKIGRAYLDSLLNTATKDGGFEQAKTVASAWQKLGSETKTLLYKDPAYITDLDRFFLLAKKVAENPNPSGTASAAMKLGEISLAAGHLPTFIVSELGSTALSQLLHSPKGVRLLTQGLSVSPLQTTRATMILGQLRALLPDEMALPLVPATADQQAAPDRIQ